MEAGLGVGIDTLRSWSEEGFEKLRTSRFQDPAAVNRIIHSSSYVYI